MRTQSGHGSCFLGGTGPVESRTVRWVGSSTERRGDFGPTDVKLDSSIDTATRPACSIGAVRVVSGGLQKSAPKMLSKPTTLTSSGTRTLRSRNRVSMPIASRSLNAIAAVAPLLRRASAAAAPDVVLEANAPVRHPSTPSLFAVDRMARQRFSFDQELRGPDT